MAGRKIGRPKNTRAKQLAAKEAHNESQRRWRLRNKIYDAWDHLKISAKKRGIEVRLTYEEFTDWCLGNNYHELRGRGPGCMSIDRPNPHEKVYHLGNMVMKEYIQNCTEGGAYGAAIKYGTWEPFDTDVEF